MAFDIMKLFEDNSFISPGSIGGKIKKIRELRKLTQKQLGERCGFSSSTADVRIAQYEKNKKIPREKAIKDITNALEIDEYSLFDADLLPYSRMYHALFDIEDFHGLHPVKKDNGFYLEFSGKTVDDRTVRKQDFDNFLNAWYEAYQKYLPSSDDSNEVKEKKAADYALWKYEYPNNKAEEDTRKMVNQMKMNNLQAQMDALNAEMQSEAEFARIDKALVPFIENEKITHKKLKKESELILFIKEMYEAGVPLLRYAPDSLNENNLDYVHILSCKTDDVIENDKNKEYFARFMGYVNDMKDAGINVDRRISSKDKVLYITYEVVSSQVDYVYNLLKAWEDIVFIGDRLDTWSDEEIEDLNKIFLKKITEKNDVKYSV